MPPFPIGSTACDHAKSEREDVVVRLSYHHSPSSKVDNGLLAIPGLTERIKWLILIWTGNFSTTEVPLADFQDLKDGNGPQPLAQLAS